MAIDYLVTVKGLRPGSVRSYSDTIFRPGHQGLLCHHGRHRVHADLPAQRPQVGADPRRPIRSVMLREQRPDQRGQPGPARPAHRRVAVTPLIEPGLRHPQRPTRGCVRDPVLRPLGHDRGGKLYRPIASFTQRAVERLSTSRSIASSALSRRSRTSSARSLSPRTPSPPSRARRYPAHPVAQGALIHAQLPSHHRDRLARLPNDPHRAFPELRIKLPSRIHRRFLLSDVSTIRGESHKALTDYVGRRGARVYTPVLGAKFASLTTSPRTGRFSVQRRFDYRRLISVFDAYVNTGGVC